MPPRSGEVVKKTGYYQSACIHRRKLRLKKGETFPPCPECGKVHWENT